jgi:hypothetical protein
MSMFCNGLKGRRGGIHTLVACSINLCGAIFYLVTCRELWVVGCGLWTWSIIKYELLAFNTTLFKSITMWCGTDNINWIYIYIYPYLVWMREILCGILSVPHNIVMHLNWLWKLNLCGLILYLVMCCELWLVACGHEVS